MEKIFNYQPSKATKEFAMKFSKDVVKTTQGYIKKRNQTDIPKMIMDHYYGKLGELAVWHYFTKILGREMQPPDFTTTKRKSFARDLELGDHEIHVKSQHILQANKFSLSWTLQKWDKLVTEPRPNELFAFCLVQEDDSVDFLKVIKANEVKYGEPRAVKLRENKTVIYFDDNENVENFNEIFK